MNQKSVLLYYLTAGWAIVTAAIGLNFVLGSTKPTADIEAKYQTNLRFLSVEDWKPGDFRTLVFNGKPIVLWRRDLEEIAAAMAQVGSDISEEEWTEVLNDGTLALEIGVEAYTKIEWLLVSPVNTGGHGCIVQTKAGDYGGFFDPCQDVHFDMWGRPKRDQPRRH